jgi:oligopeptide/dipeptide ABC transporter ATP-binding protein
MPAAEPLLEVRDLAVGFADRRGVFLAVEGFSLAVETGQAVGLLGESGCGKSVTLRALLDLVPYPGEVVSGTVSWKGRDLRKVARRDLLKIRGKEIAMVFQDPAACLNPVLTVGSQIVEMLRVKLNMPAKAARARAAELLSHVGIPAARERLQLHPHQLSGGMRQRVMIAMAVAARPDLLLADEPTTALDVTIQDQILKLLATLRDESGMAMILVSHDVGVVAQNCDVIVVMYAGRVMEAGPAGDVVHRPRHPYTRGLLAAIPDIEAGGGRLNPILGQPPSVSEFVPGCPFQPRCAFARADCGTLPVVLDRAPPAHGSACPFVD